MDYDSSSKFISSLAKFLQSLCNGYVEFDSGVQVIGHLYLSVDTGKTIDYILNEKVCKTDENSVTFISNSFHAQPAEKPKATGKKPSKDSDKSDLKSEQEAEVAASQAEPRSTNVGTLPATRNSSQNSYSQGTKRPFSPSHKSHSKSGRSSPRNKKNRTDSSDQNTAHVSDPANESSVLSAPSPAGDSDSELGSGQGSAAPHGAGLNEAYQQNYFNPDEENLLASESNTHDIKPSIDTDVTFIKEEYIPSSQSSAHGHDRSQGDESSAYPYQTNSLYPSNYASLGGYGTPQRSSYPSSNMYSPGHHASLKNDDSSADPSAPIGFPSSGGPYRYYCELCLAGFNYSQNLIRHKRTVHGQSDQKEWYHCQVCDHGFLRKDVYKRHLGAISHVLKCKGWQKAQEEEDGGKRLSQEEVPQPDSL